MKVPHALAGDLLALAGPTRCLLAMHAVALSLIAPAAAQEHDATRLAKAAQNPIADMVSLPLQYNLNMETGPYD